MWQRHRTTWRGGTPHGKNVYWEGGHPTYFLDGGNSGEKTKTGWGAYSTYFVEGEQLGWGHSTTLKGNMLGNHSDTFQTHSGILQTYSRLIQTPSTHLPDIL